MKEENYNFAAVVEQVSKQEEKELADVLRDVAEDYYDYTPNTEQMFIDWKKTAGKAVKFHICEEIVDKAQFHIFQKILVVMKGENLQKKLTALRRLGYTAKLVKAL
jgi:hypothetical protein